MDEIIFTPKLVSQFTTIIGWFWLMMYMIYRYKYIEKWKFVVYIFISFGMALAKVQELIVFEFNLDKNIGLYHVVNYLLILMSWKHINLLVKIKENEKS